MFKITLKNLVELFLTGKQPDFYRFDIYEDEEENLGRIEVRKVSVVSSDEPMSHRLEIELFAFEMYSLSEALQFMKRLEVEGNNIVVAYREDFYGY